MKMSLLSRMLLLCSLAALTACATTIPEVDDTPPRVELRISGPGVGNETMSNPPRSSWTAPSGTQYLDLLPDETYRFTLTVTDQGGVARATLAFFSDLEVIELDSDAVVEDVGPVTTRLTLRGDRSDPRTGLVIGGRLRTPALGPGEGVGFSFDAESSDFGGHSGRDPNQTFMEVTAYIPAP